MTATPARLKRDVALLVRTAKEQGRAGMTMARYLRMNLFFDDCRGWSLVCTPMPNNGKLAEMMHRNKSVGLALACTIVDEAMNEAGVKGHFSQPCEQENEGIESYHFQWVSS